ncbi:MAG: flavin reductase family protein [Flammeovirgaceae bacterium]|nr:flavin reductase family protein [Flammeovirgaceae bacterium]
MVEVNPKEIPVGKMHSYLLGAVIPRPIAFASTVDLQGNVNLSPFSFFNVFSANPPILIFSPSRRGRDNSTKHTYENVLEVPEVVINIVTYKMVEQASLASVEYAKGVNEFVKAGFAEEKSKIVKPPRVRESPISFECKVNGVIPLGKEGGAGNLVIAEVLLMHINENVLDDEGKIDPYKLDAVARMGGDLYSRAKGEVFKVPKPVNSVGIGFDNIPDHIRKSNVLTGNDLGRLGNVEQLPSGKQIEEFSGRQDVQDAHQMGIKDVHRLAQKFLTSEKVLEAWMVLLSKNH